MPDRFLYLNGGITTEKAAIDSSAGVADAGKITALDSTGKLDATLFPTGIGAELKVAVASESLAAGALVNIWNNAGTEGARNADASAGIGKSADGFVLGSVASSGSAQIFIGRGSIISGLAGLTPGAFYYLSGTTPGAITTTAPTTAGYVCQVVGKALSATEFLFAPERPVVRG